jgi:hypothetical protein
MSDLDGVSLAGVKALDARTSTQSEQIQALAEENRQLRDEAAQARGDAARALAETEALRAQNQALEARLRRPVPSRATPAAAELSPSVARPLKKGMPETGIPFTLRPQAPPFASGGGAPRRGSRGAAAGVGPARR